MNFKKEEIFRKHFILHQLSQIAREGRYYLSPLKLVCYIPDNCTEEELINILKENNRSVEGFINNNIVALVEFINYSVDSNCLIKDELTDEEIYDMKTSKHSYENCGYELFSYQDEIGYCNQESHKWLLNQLRMRCLDENDLYTISVDNLEFPRKAFIYRIDDNEDSQLVFTCDL